MSNHLGRVETLSKTNGQIESMEDLDNHPQPSDLVNGPLQSQLVLAIVCKNGKEKVGFSPRRQRILVFAGYSGSLQNSLPALNMQI